MLSRFGPLDSRWKLVRRTECDWYRWGYPRCSSGLPWRAEPSAACARATTVLFQDNFDQLQPTWGEPNEALKLDGGQLVVTPAADHYFWQPNTANLYDDIDLCVNMTTVTGVDPEEAKAGLLFWYVDINNFYVFELAPNGKASVWRRQRGRWLAQVAWQDAKAANQGDGAINELRVTTVGSQATFYVNGKSSRSSPARRPTTASRWESSPYRPPREPRHSPSTTSR